VPRLEYYPYHCCSHRIRKIWCCYIFIHRDRFIETSGGNWCLSPATLSRSCRKFIFARMAFSTTCTVTLTLTKNLLPVAANNVVRSIGDTYSLFSFVHLHQLWHPTRTWQSMPQSRSYPRIFSAPSSQSSRKGSGLGLGFNREDGMNNRHADDSRSKVSFFHSLVHSPVEMMNRREIGSTIPFATTNRRKRPGENDDVSSIFATIAMNEH
jgi:hypothetical protein